MRWPGLFGTERLLLLGGFATQIEGASTVRVDGKEAFVQ
jgi:hypothetical protein